MNEQPTTEEKASREKVWKLVSDIKFAMMTTQGNDGELRSRPMTTLDHESDGTLWFFAGRSNDITRELQENPRINLAFADNDGHRYVSLTATARVVDDREKIKALWNPLFNAYFPQGLEDPDLCLLRVDGQSAEYWESSNGIMVKLIEIGAALTGKAHGPLGESGTVDL